MGDYDEFSDVAALNAARLAAPIFAAEGWTYGGHNITKAEVPDIVELFRSIRRCIELLDNGDAKRVETGRWRVERDVDGSVEIYLHLGSSFDEHRRAER